MKGETTMTNEWQLCARVEGLRADVRKADATLHPPSIGIGLCDRRIATLEAEIEALRNTARAQAERLGNKHPFEDYLSPRDVEKRETEIANEKTKRKALQARYDELERAAAPARAALRVAEQDLAEFRAAQHATERTAVDAARAAHVEASRVSDEAAVAAESATQTVMASESTFGATGADEDWRAVEAARSARDRAVVRADQLRQTRDATHAALLRADAALSKARVDSALATVDRAAHCARITPDLRRIVELERELSQAVGRILTAENEQRLAFRRAHELGATTATQLAERERVIVLARRAIHEARVARVCDLPSVAGYVEPLSLTTLGGQVDDPAFIPVIRDAAGVGGRA